MRYALTLLAAALLSPVIATADWTDVDTVEESRCTHKYDAKGSGRYSGPDHHGSDIERVHLEIEDHHFRLTLYLERGKEVFLNGKSSDFGHHQTVVIRPGRGGKFNGRGDIELRDNESGLEAVSGSGDLDGDHFSFRFTAEDDHHYRRDDNDHDRDRDGRHDDHDYDHGDHHSFSDNVNGWGTLEIEDDENRLTNMRVSMARNGDLHLRVEGPHHHDVEFDGRWRGDGPEYKVSITRMNGRSCDIDGEMRLSRNGSFFESISIKGEQGRDDVKLSFRGR